MAPHVLELAAAAAVQLALVWWLLPGFQEAARLRRIRRDQSREPRGTSA